MLYKPAASWNVVPSVGIHCCLDRRAGRNVNGCSISIATHSKAAGAKLITAGGRIWVLPDIVPGMG